MQGSAKTGRTDQLNPAQIIDPEHCKLVDGFCFKPLHFGMLCSSLIQEEVVFEFYLSLYLQHPALCLAQCALSE